MSRKHSYLLLASLLAIPLYGFAEKNDSFPKIPCAMPSLAAPSLKQMENEAHPQETSKYSESVKTESSQPFHPFTGKVNGNKVRVRALPGLDGHVVKETSPGELFVVTGEENGFYAVRPPKGMKGYVFRTFVLDNTVEGERVNVRLTPDIESPVVGKLNSGEKIQSVVSAENNKWLEIDLPANSRFYIAKEYVDHAGGVDFFEKIEARRNEASSCLTDALFYARSEIERPFEEIDLDGIHAKFATLFNRYSDFSDVMEKAKDANTVIQETYVQKKIAFLESKADRTTASKELSQENIKKLAEMSHSLASEQKTPIKTSGYETSALQTDKMLIWKPLEESRFHVWAMANEGKTLEDFYEEEELNSTVLTGILETYNRPVKNRPGDFLLRIENRPVAFLYSTKVNLQDKVGKAVTIKAAPRPNNNFAFPAYFVFSVE